MAARTTFEPTLTTYPISDASPSVDGLAKPGPELVMEPPSTLVATPTVSQPDGQTKPGEKYARVEPTGTTSKSTEL